MIGRIKVRTRGPVGRGLRKAMNAAQKVAWQETGKVFASENIPRRFTTEFAREARYTPRAGQNFPQESKAFKRSYSGRKLRKFGHMDPFVWSGETRRAARVASVSSTSSGARVRLPGTGRLNFNPKYAAEFRAVTNRETRDLAKRFDGLLDTELKKDSE